MMPPCGPARSRDSHPDPRYPWRPPCKSGCLDDPHDVCSRLRRGTIGACVIAMWHRARHHHLPIGHEHPSSDGQLSAAPAKLKRADAEAIYEGGREAVVEALLRLDRLVQELS